MSAARKLLAANQLEDLSLPIIAREADIAPSSTYHFFGDVAELYRELAVLIASEMVGLMPDDLTPQCWEDVAQAYFESAASYFNADPAALQLILGEHTTAEIKRAACRQNDAPFGDELAMVIDRYFALPSLPATHDLFFRAIQIADLMFCLSVADHGTITPEMLAEASRAACAYLGLYLPRHLPRRMPPRPIGNAAQGTVPVSPLAEPARQEPIRAER